MSSCYHDISPPVSIPIESLLSHEFRQDGLPVGAFRRPSRNSVIWLSIHLDRRVKPQPTGSPDILSKTLEKSVCRKIQHSQVPQDTAQQSQHPQQKRHFPGNVSKSSKSSAHTFISDGVVQRLSWLIVWQKWAEKDMTMMLQSAMPSYWPSLKSQASKVLWLVLRRPFRTHLSKSFL